MLISDTLQSLSAARIRLIIGTLLLLFTLMGMGVDLIAPSLPMIAHGLHASDSFSKSLISIYLLGMIASNCSIGFLSDSIGRRPAVLCALLTFVIASFLPVVFSSPITLIISRFFQGAMLSFSGIMSRAILSDLLPPARLMKVTAFTATMWGIGPIIGPMIGGYLQFYFNWQACFCFYAACALVVLLILFFVLPETHFKRQAFNIKQLRQNYVEILSHRSFLCMIFMMGLTYSLLIVFNTIGPFLIQNTLGFSPIAFGHIALCCGIIFLLGTLLAKQLLQSYESKILLKNILPLGLICSLIALGFVYFYSKSLGLIVGPTLIMFLICGILYPTTMATAVVLFRHLAASAGAIMSSINIFITCLSSFVMSFFSAGTAIPLISAYAVLMTLCFVIFKLMSISPRQ